MKLRRFQFLAALSLAALSIACDERDLPTQAAAVTQAPEYHGPAGSIHGSVNLTGWAASNKPNIVQCGNHSHAVADESVVVNSAGQLRNVIVYLKAAATASPISAEPIVLDQKNCSYEPHVVALHTGQILRIKSSDQTIHNVHLLCDANPAANFGMIQPGQRDFVLKFPERFTVKCDVHPWMLAHVAVFDHPWFAVTADNGEFEIKNIPLGSYELVAWQERFGELQQNVTIAAGQQTSASFTFKPPTAGHNE